MKSLVLGLAIGLAASVSALAEAPLRWGPSLHRCLDSLQDSRAAQVAENLDFRLRQGLDISEEQLKRLESLGVKTLADLQAHLSRSVAAAGEERDAFERIARSFRALAPAIEYLEAKGLRPEAPAASVSAHLAEAFAAHSRKANARARRILAGFSDDSRAPAAVVRDASDAEELVYHQYPYLEDLAWHRLLEIYEDLDSRGKIARRKLVQEGIAARRTAAIQIARADAARDWQVRDAMASAPSPRSLVERIRSKCRALVSRLRRVFSR